MNEIELRKILQEHDHDPGTFQPFKVDFSLMSPIVMAHPYIHFDSIIAHLLLRKLLGPDFYLLPTNLPIDFFSILKLPLKKYPHEKNPFYHGSVSLFKNENLSTSTIYKRFHERDLGYLKTKKKKIATNSGTLKDHAIKLPQISTTNVYFYGNGNINEIRRLLEGLPGLGKKISIGHGFIKNFEVKKIENDYSILKNGWTMRPIPINAVNLTTNVKKIILSYKFPYWAKTNITLCIPPGEKISIDQ